MSRQPTYRRIPSRLLRRIEHAADVMLRAGSALGPLSGPVRFLLLQQARDLQRVVAWDKRKPLLTKDRSHRWAHLPRGQRPPGYN